MSYTRWSGSLKSLRAWTTNPDNSKVEQYTIIIGPPDDVQSKVNTLLAGGWEIHGTLYTYTSATTPQTLFAQAMIKKEPPNASSPKVS